MPRANAGIVSPARGILALLVMAGCSGDTTEPHVLNDASFTNELVAIGSCTPTPSGAISWWRAEDNAEDAIGSHTGTLENGASFASGRVGQAFLLDGLNDWITLGNPPALKLTTGITIEAWIRPTTPANTYSVIASKWGQAPWLDSYWFALDMSTAEIRLLGVINQAVDNPYLAASGGNVEAGVWSHVALTYDAGSGLLALYVNGSAVASSTRPATMTTSDVSVILGGEAAGPAFRPFPGSLDEITIYDRALSAQEVLAIAEAAEAGKCPTDQVITFTSLPPAPAKVGTSYAVSATGGGSGNPILFTTPDTPCSVSGSVVSFVATGTCIITANQDGNETYAAAQQVDQTFIVDQGDQTITITASPPNPAYVGHTYLITATGGGSGNPVTFSSLTPLVCTGSGSMVSLVAVGTCIVAADQAGNSGYRPARRESQQFAVIYAFTGFFQPVDMAPTQNKVKAGSAIPIKFSLDGDMGLDIFAPQFPNQAKGGCPNTITDIIEATVTAGSSGLSYSPVTQQYTYVWKTDKAWANTCRILMVQLKDHTTHTALFTFTK